MTGRMTELDVAAMNELRVKAGLAPLLSGPPAKAKAPEPKPKPEAEEEVQAAPSTQELRAKLARARQRREDDAAAALLQGKGLGHASDEEDDDAAAWVERSRRLAQVRKEAERRSKRATLSAQQLYGEEEEEEEGDDSVMVLKYKLRMQRERAAAKAKYDAEQLSGLAVGHDMADVAVAAEEGMIMTLADADVMDDDAEDTLQSAALQDAHRRRLNAAVRRQAKGPVYDPYAEGEDGKAAPLLAHYDDPRDAEGPKFRLGQSGAVDTSTNVAARQASIRAKLAAQAAARQQSLAAEPSGKVGSAYLSRQEMKDLLRQAQGGRMPKKGKKKGKKKDKKKDKKKKGKATRKRGRSRRTLDITGRDHGDAGEEAAHAKKGDSAAEMKPEEALEDDHDDAQDRGSRAARMAALRAQGAQAKRSRTGGSAGVALGGSAARKKELVAKEARYQRALRKAVLDSQVLRMDEGDDGPSDAAAGDSQEVGALAGTSRAAGPSAAELAERLRKRKEAREAARAAREQGESSAGLRFTSTSAFASRVHAKQDGDDDDVGWRTLRGTDMDTTAAAAAASSSSAAASSPGGASAEANTTSTILDDVVERAAQPGIGGTLALLRSMQGSATSTDLDLGLSARRANDRLDTPQFDAHTKQDGSRIRLERYDEHGHLLTPKEAFRRLCHRFHGYGPGKNKQEKLLQRRKREKYVMEGATEDALAQRMAAQEREQRKAGRAFIPLSFGTSRLQDLEREATHMVSKGSKK